MAAKKDKSKEAGTVDVSLSDSAKSAVPTSSSTVPAKDEGSKRPLPKKVPRKARAKKEPKPKIENKQLAAYVRICRQALKGKDDLVAKVDTVAGDYLSNKLSEQEAIEGLNSIMQAVPTHLA